MISKIPNLDIAQLRFMVSHHDIDQKVKAEKWDKLIQVGLPLPATPTMMLRKVAVVSLCELYLRFQLIKENEMGPYYKLVCDEIGTPRNESLFAELKEANEKRLKEIDDEIKDAEQNLGLFFAICAQLLFRTVTSCESKACSDYLVMGRMYFF